MKHYTDNVRYVVEDEREVNPYEKAKGKDLSKSYDKSFGYLKDSLKIAIQASINSNDPEVRAKGIELGQYLNSKFSNWDDIVYQPVLVNQVVNELEKLVSKDDSLASFVEGVNLAKSDMVSDAEHLRREEEGRNSTKPPELERVKEYVNPMTGNKVYIDMETGRYADNFEEFDEALTKEVDKQFVEQVLGGKEPSEIYGDGLGDMQVK